MSTLHRSPSSGFRPPSAPRGEGTWITVPCGIAASGHFMADIPQAVRAHQDEGYLEIRWPSGIAHHYPYKFLRGLCPCAECVDENTGIRTLDVESVSDQIRPMHLSFSGNYALKIHWNDGHQTGLYTWDHLERMSKDPAVTKANLESP